LNKYIKCNFGGWRCGTSTIDDISGLKVNEFMYRNDPDIYALQTILGTGQNCVICHKLTS